MASIRPADIARFLASGCRSTPIILVFGPDEGAVRARVHALASTLLGTEPDGLSRVELDAEMINADPARLIDEANAIGMFGGKRLIIVRHAGKLQKSAWQPLIALPPVDSTVVLQADDLGKASPLRVALEEAQCAGVVVCYPPSRQDLQLLIDERADTAGLAMTPVARAYLVDLLGSDLALATLEIDKLLLYCRGQITVDVADIDALIADSSELAGSEPIDRAFEGRLGEIESVAIRAFREGINPSGMLAIALNHALLIRRLAIAKSGNALDSAVRSERLFYRRQDRIRAQANAWGIAAAGRAVETLANAQDQSRRSPGLDETIAVRALWAIALASRKR